MDIQSLIRKKAREAGIDPTHALTMASIESSFDPKAANKYGYKGLYQFGPNEWKQWGGGKDVFDPEANIDAFIGYHGQIKDQLKTALGRDPTPQELYLGWQQGAGGASKLLTNADAPAKSLVSPDAVLANGGDSNMTGGQFASLWQNKYNAHNKSILGQSSGWTGEGDTQESKWIGPAPGSGPAPGAFAQPEPGTGGLLDPDYGVTAGDSAAAAKAVNAAVPAKPAPNYNALIGSGLAMMAAGDAPPPQQAGWQQGGNMPQAVRGNPQLAGLLTDLMRKKNPFAGLLGEF